MKLVSLSLLGETFCYKNISLPFHSYCVARVRVDENEYVFILLFFRRQSALKKIEFLCGINGQEFSDFHNIELLMDLLTIESS